MRDARFATKAVHSGQPPDPTTGAIVTPIHPTTTYAQEGIGQHKGYEYSRTGNPTRAALEACIADLEGAHRGFAFATGMAAIMTVTNLLKSGAHIVAEENVYGGTVRYFDRVARKFGVEVDFVDASDVANVERAMRPTTVMIYAESPTNPNLKLDDLAAIGTLAKRKNVLFAVDSTFASPYIQRPHEFGADLVIHSATKYLGGHSDALGGIVTTASPKLSEDVAFLQNAIGAVLSPFDSWIILRGIKTLPIRMERHCANAQVVAEFLASHPKVARVNYPGLPQHPQHALAKRQMGGRFGGMLSFELRGGAAAAREFVRVVELFTLAESLGAVESLLSHPASMTHASVPEEIRARSGITDGLLRLSVGIEDADDLVSDLRKALDKV
ncbi:MAG: trans-sulfuration enzyme family protein [Thermoplasmatota archaeon]